MIISLLMLMYPSMISWAFLGALVLVGTLCQALVSGGGDARPTAAVAKNFSSGRGGGAGNLGGAACGAGGGGAAAVGGGRERSSWTIDLVACSSDCKPWTSLISALY